MELPLGMKASWVKTASISREKRIIVSNGEKKSTYENLLEFIQCVCIQKLYRGKFMPVDEKWLCGSEHKII